VSKKKFLLDALKYIFFFGAGIMLFIWVYQGQDLRNIWEGLSRFHYGWIAASFIVFLFSHLFRAMRWRMLIESIGYKPGLFNTFLSILVMYLANYALPRLGEVTRCGILKRYEGVPFTSQLGTVLVERIVDVLFLLNKTSLTGKFILLSLSLRISDHPSHQSSIRAAIWVYFRIRVRFPS